MCLTTRWTGVPNKVASEGITVTRANEPEDCITGEYDKIITA